MREKGARLGARGVGRGAGKGAHATAAGSATSNKMLLIRNFWASIVLRTQGCRKSAAQQSTCFEREMLAFRTLGSKLARPLAARGAVRQITVASLENFKFDAIRESEVSRAMTTRYMKDMYDFAEADVIITGAGSAGLSCAYELSKYPELKIAIIEQSVSPGGGAWLGGQLMSAMVVRKPAHLWLDELGIEYEEMERFVIVKHAALFTSTIMAKVLAAPNIKLFNATAVEDLIIKVCSAPSARPRERAMRRPHGRQFARSREPPSRPPHTKPHIPSNRAPSSTPPFPPQNDRISGVVTNWSLVTQHHDTQSCMDPNVMESKMLVSACGHDGPMGAFGVKRLQQVRAARHELPHRAPPCRRPTWARVVLLVRARCVSWGSCRPHHARLGCRSA